jgi:hypothetical protein
VNEDDADMLLPWRAVGCELYDSSGKDIGTMDSPMIAEFVAQLTSELEPAPVTQREAGALNLLGARFEKWAQAADRWKRDVPERYDEYHVTSKVWRMAKRDVLRALRNAPYTPQKMRAEQRKDAPPPRELRGDAE